LPRIEDSRQFLELDLDRSRCLSGSPWAVGDNSHNRLAREVHFALGQKGFVEDDSADLVLSRNVGGCQDTQDTFDFGSWGRVEPYDAAVRNWRSEDRNVEETRWIREIADEQRLASGMGADFVVAHALASSRSSAPMPNRTLK
jgi:hypothetical protein